MIFLYANSLQIICADYYRGKHDFYDMNFINIWFWVTALVVLIVLLLIRVDFIDFLYRFFFIYALLSFIINWMIILRSKDFKKNLISNFKESLKISSYKLNWDFYKYGVLRLPNGFFLAAIFSVPIIVASSSMSLTTAAYIGIIIAIVRMVQLLGMPFNLIFLPKFSYYKSAKNDEIIRYNSKVVVEFIFTLPLVVGLLVYFVSPEMIFFWFGSKYTIVVKYLEYISPLIGLLIGYILIRGILDGLYAFPYSNIITFCSFISVGILLLLSSIYSWGLLGLTISFGSGMFFLGIISMYILSLIHI